MHVHHWPMEYVETLPVYEKHIYLDLLSQYVKHQEDINRDAIQSKKYQTQKKQAQHPGMR